MQFIGEGVWALVLEYILKRMKVLFSETIGKKHKRSNAPRGTITRKWRVNVKAELTLIFTMFVLIFEGQSLILSYLNVLKW